MNTAGDCIDGTVVAQPARSARILFLDHVGEVGGAELCLIDMARHWRGRSRVVLMAEGPLRTALTDVGADVEVLPLSRAIAGVRRKSGVARTLLAGFRLAPLAWKIARRAKRYDLIWATSQKSFVIGCLAAFLSRRPLVWHLHDILSQDHFSLANRRMVAALANLFATRVITVSRAALQGFQGSGGRAGLGRVIYNGIDPASFEIHSQSVDAPGSLRDELGVANAPLVGVFGRLTAWKGQDVLIRALPTLPGVHAVFVGAALFESDEYLHHLRQLSQELGVSDRTHFTGFRSDVAEVMAQVDLVAHTSIAPEPFGRVLVEAMLARRPVIASAGGGASEIITDRVDGVLISPGKPELLGQAIRELLGDPSLVSALVAAGYETARKKFSRDAFLRQTDEAVNELLNQEPPKAFERNS